jgi:hypothetical protein
MFRIGGQEKREYLETGRELEPAAAFREEYSPCDAAKAVSATTSLFSLFFRSKSHIFLFEIMEENLSDLFLRMNSPSK